MASETATVPRGTQREAISIPVTPVDERLFKSEIQRIDFTVSGEQKNREKFETRIEKAVNDLRSDMNSRFEKSDAKIDSLRNHMNSRFEKLEKSVDTRFEKLEKSVDARFEKVDARFGQIDQKFEKMIDKMDSNFKWLITTYITVMGVVLAAFYAFSPYIKK